MTKASLDQELKLFKAIVRQIARHELNDEQTKFFHMERRAHLRRLAPLGIEGNEPAAKAYCKVTPQEGDRIIEAILKQKVGANAKNLKQYADYKERKKQDLTDGNQDHMLMLVKKARLAKGAVVRWTRSIAERKRHDEEETGDEHQEEDESQKYVSRLLACTRCGQQQETIWMQLRTTLGYRGIHCRVCGKQELCARNKCQCDLIWHQCKLHRIDPSRHKSRKADKLTAEQKQKRLEEDEKKTLNKPERKRKAPEVHEGVGKVKSTTAQKLAKEVEFRKRQDSYQHKHTVHSACMLERILRRKTSQTTSMRKDSRSSNSNSSHRSSTSPTVQQKQRSQIAASR